MFGTWVAYVSSASCSALPRPRALRAIQLFYRDISFVEEAWSEARLVALVRSVDILEAGQY